ncbi:MAG: anhydro-N-acetylmuramic acid kinase [Bacteroidota bacterium]
MIYRAIGIMSGSSLDGLDIAFTEFTETGGKWSYEILNAECLEYSKKWQEKLRDAVLLSALDYQLLHTEYGHYVGKKVTEFIKKYGLEHQVSLVASHGHTTFHLPQQLMTAQLGDGAAIAAETKLNVVSDLRSLDVALGGQGAPIVPIGEKLLFAGYDYFLNIGGIANISINTDEKHVAYDVCAANRVLNMLAAEEGLPYDDGGKLAASGKVNEYLLGELNSLDYYRKAYPKSLANSFGTDIVFPIIKASGVSVQDGLRTCVEHIALQVKHAIPDEENTRKLLVTGGGAMNSFLIERLQALLVEKNIEVVIPDEKTIQYKEAVIMALIGILRWREEENVLPSVTGASRGSVGGSLWIG